MEKYIGLDLGTTTIGVVYSDSLGIIHDKENFRFEPGNYKKARERVIYHVDNLKIKNIVIGFPLQLDRTEGKRCESVRRFVKDLLKLDNELNIVMFDESFSTIEARERLQATGYKESKIKEIIDMISAKIILEDFLRNKENGKN